MQVLSLLETLCGPQSSQLKVADMDSYSFNPKSVVVQLASLLVYGWRLEGSVRSLVIHSCVEYPEYTGSTMTKCVSVLASENSTLSSDLGQLVSEVVHTRTHTHTHTNYFSIS